MWTGLHPFAIVKPSCFGQKNGDDPVLARGQLRRLRVDRFHLECGKRCPLAAEADGNERMLQADGLHGRLMPTSGLSSAASSFSSVVQIITETSSDRLSTDRSAVQSP